MKYLKYLLLIIVLLVVIFLGRGLISPIVEYENEIVINKPAEEVWAIMSDELRASDWIEGLKKMEHVSGEPNTVGAVSNIYVEENGEEMVMQETITQLIPNEKMAMTFTMDFMDMDYQISLNEKDDTTTLKSISSTKGNGLFAKSMVAFMKGTMKDQEDANLQKLKKLVEENTKNYFINEINEVSDSLSN